MTRECFADWLRAHRTHEDLVSETETLFRESCPRMPAQMRADLHLFLDDRSDRALAGCLALNVDPHAFDDFIDWCRDRASEPRDPHVRFGVSERDLREDVL